MNEIAVVSVQHLPSLIDRATSALASARTSAEVLEARDMAGFAYDAAKRAARLEKAVNAHGTLVAAAHRAQADALEIESQAKRRLADEYDAAQERGEVAGHGGGRGNQHVANVPNGNVATASDLGLTRKAIHDARQIRDAEVRDPGIIRRTLDERLERGEEPSRAALRQSVVDAALRGLRPAHTPSRNNPHRQHNPQFEAMLVVAGGCRDMMDKVRDCEPEYILSGFTDEAQRHRNLRSMRECRDFLTTILEAADAEEARA